MIRSVCANTALDRPKYDEDECRARGMTFAAPIKVVVRLVVDEALPGGLAIYGARFGRYPVDPSVVFGLRDGAATPR